MKPSDFCIITTTTDTEENANSIASTLLQKQLIACAQRSTTHSSYRWKGKIIESKEILLEMKSKKSLFHMIRKEVARLHTYDVPEIIMIPLEGANDLYLRWIEQETKE
jgi:periplasmic divalent cation tolerance protein